MQKKSDLKIKCTRSTIGVWIDHLSLAKPCLGAKFTRHLEPSCATGYVTFIITLIFVRSDGGASNTHSVFACFVLKSPPESSDFAESDANAWCYVVLMYCETTTFRMRLVFLNHFFWFLTVDFRILGHAISPNKYKCEKAFSRERGCVYPPKKTFGGTRHPLVETTFCSFALFTNFTKISSVRKFVPFSFVVLLV